MTTVTRATDAEIRKARATAEWARAAAREIAAHADTVSTIADRLLAISAGLAEIEGDEDADDRTG